MEALEDTAITEITVEIRDTEQTLHILTTLTRTEITIIRTQQMATMDLEVGMDLYLEVGKQVANEQSKYVNYNES